MAENGRLSPKQEKALGALLEGKNIRQAAQLAGVGERTLYRWLKMPAFVVHLKAGEGRTLQVVGVRLAGMSEKALDVLQDILDSDGNVPGAGVRRMAACAVLDILARWVELVNFEERLAAVEAQYAQK